MPVETLMRRNSVYVGFVLAGALVGEYAMDKVGDAYWESRNAGVSLLLNISWALLPV